MMSYLYPKLVLGLFLVEGIIEPLCIDSRAQAHSNHLHS